MKSRRRRRRRRLGSKVYIVLRRGEEAARLTSRLPPSFSYASQSLPHIITYAARLRM